MKKNPTPTGIALTSAGIVGLSVLALLLVLKLVSENHIPTLLLILVPILTFCVCFIVFTFFLKQFIYRKIKLIYKNILEQKSENTLRYDNLNLEEDILGSVEQEVKDWGVANKKEKHEQKKMETYRREFLGNVSHELKTPLFNMQGYIHTLLDGGLHDETINSSYLRKADINIDRMISIVGDLELITKNETDELGLEFKKFDIHKLSEEVIDLQSLQAKERDTRVIFKTGCDVPFYVYGDEDRIRQVLINLITNALKYGREGGKVSIGFYDMDKHLLIEVTDDGIGIPEADLNRVFERFYRVDKSRSRAAGGTGLGLAIVKHIIEAHKQTITLRSTLGQGSTFGFTMQKAV